MVSGNIGNSVSAPFKHGAGNRVRRYGKKILGSSAFSSAKTMEVDRPFIRFVVIQPTPFCNISCSYCYLPSKHITNVMSVDTFSNCISKILNSNHAGRNIEIIWHAGEPLAVPLDFYKTAVAAVRNMTPSSVVVNFAVQTNGILLTDDWARFFFENEFDVGISIDGPRDIHDNYRRTRSGRGTFDKALAGFQVAKRAGLDPSIISVLTLDALHDPDKMFEFYQSNGMRRVGFSVLEQDGVCTNALLKSAEYQDMYRAFMLRFWNLCHSSQERWSIREFDIAIRSLIWPSETSIPNYQTKSLGFVGIDWEGNCYSFSPEFIGLQHQRLKFNLGNLLNKNLDDILASENYQTLSQEIARGVNRCEADCEYFSICGGGSPANKLGEHGRMDVTETDYCRLTKKFIFDMVLTSLENGG